MVNPHTGDNFMLLCWVAYMAILGLFIIIGAIKWIIEGRQPSDNNENEIEVKQEDIISSCPIQKTDAKKEP